MFAPTMWFLVNNDVGLDDIDTTLRSIEKAGFARQNVRIASYTIAFRTR